MGKDRGLNRVPRALLVLWLGMILLDTWVLGSGRRPGLFFDGISSQRVNQQAARLIVQNYRQLARTVGVQDEKTVEIALRKLGNRAEGKMDPEALSDLIAQVEYVEEAIRSSRAKRASAKVLDILRDDPKIHQGDKVGTILVLGHEVIAGQELLEPITIRRLKEEPILEVEAELVGIGIRAGQVDLLSIDQEMQYLAVMESKLEETKRSLEGIRRAAGYTTIAGPGVVIQASDAPGGYPWEQIVHEQDIREIVNSLYFAGAQGVEVGSQRLGVGGWVKCVGPVVVVNGETVAANPVVIKAVGLPKKLEESVRELQGIFALTGKRLDVESSDYLELESVPRVRTDIANY